jgi:hypothetical protein
MSRGTSEESLRRLQREFANLKLVRTMRMADRGEDREHKAGNQCQRHQKKVGFH